VLVIPTKESTFVRAFGDEIARGSPALAQLVARESAVRDTAVAFFAAHGIRWLDGREALAASLVRGEMPYFASEDGHPSPLGHGVLAELVERELSAPTRAAARPAR
jgi:hypothetical protein